MSNNKELEKIKEAIDSIYTFLGTIADFIVDFATVFCELFKDKKEIEFTLTPPDPIKKVKKDD